MNKEPVSFDIWRVLNQKTIHQIKYKRILDMSETYPITRMLCLKCNIMAISLIQQDSPKLIIICPSCNMKEDDMYRYIENLNREMYFIYLNDNDLDKQLEEMTGNG